MSEQFDPELLIADHHMIPVIEFGGFRNQYVIDLGTIGTAEVPEKPAAVFIFYFRMITRHTADEQLDLIILLTPDRCPFGRKLNASACLRAIQIMDLHKIKTS